MALYLADETSSGFPSAISWSRSSSVLMSVVVVISVSVLSAVVSVILYCSITPGV